VGKPHGLAGDVYVVRISDDPQRFEPGARLIHDDGREFVVERSRRHRTRFLVKFEGVHDRDAAEKLRGAVYVDASQMRALEPDEFWEHDLVGAEVVARDGARIGEVTALDAGPGQDRLVVATPHGERLIPVVREIVVEVDPEAARVVVDLPAGLLD
jgi:16S rRNA processing protein RimM